jgi:hypothetical protein
MRVARTTLLGYLWVQTGTANLVEESLRADIAQSPKLDNASTALLVPAMTCVLAPWAMGENQA